MSNLTAVYPAAGLSSRFDGKIKCLSRVGQNNETLIELSMNQAIVAGFNKFVIITSKVTLDPIKEVLGDSYKDIPVKYCIQETPEYRLKPFGTGHALLSAKGLVNEPFLYLSSDEIYGVDTFKTVFNFLKQGKDNYCIPGFRLKNVLPNNGTVNRGLIKEKDHALEKIKEQFNISVDDIPSKFTGEELISVSICGLQSNIFEFLKDDFENFLKQYPTDEKKEFLLVDSITNFAKQKNKKITVIPTNGVLLSLTNPEDEEIMRQKLINSN
jgi:NDP-sugar pyrophosphorylase family protein